MHEIELSNSQIKNKKSTSSLIATADQTSASILTGGLFKDKKDALDPP